MLISQIYNPNPFTLNSEITILEAIKIFSDSSVNGGIVTNAENQLIGIISIQDIAGAILPPEFKGNVSLASALYKPGFFKERCQQLKHAKVKDIMRTDFTTVSLHDNIMTIIADFLISDLYIIPILDEGKLVGVITRSQIKTALIDGMSIDPTITTQD